VGSRVDLATALVATSAPRRQLRDDAAPTLLRTMKLPFKRRHPLDRSSVNASAPKLVFDAAVGHRGALVAVAVCALLGAFAEAGVLVLIARLAFALASGKSSVTMDLGPLGDSAVDFGVLIAVAMGLVLVRVLFQVAQVTLTARTYAGVWLRLRSRLLTRYLGASWELQAEEREGRLQELATTYATGASNAVLLLSAALAALLSLVAFLGTAFFVNAIAALVVVAAATLVALVLRPIRKAVRGRARASALANLAVATDVTEIASTMQEIRVFNVEGVVAQRVDERLVTTSSLLQRSQSLTQLTPALYQGIALALVVGAVGVVYAAGVSRLAALGGIVLIMVRSLSYAQQLQTGYQGLYASAPFFEGLGDEDRRLASAALPTNGSVIERISELRFEDVEYSYKPGVPVLRDVSFVIAPRELVGIVGPSGSGKSTLVQILLRLREPDCGRVLADGIDVSTISLDSWYRHVSFVPQDVRMIAGSVADNVRFYRDLDDDAVERAARAANLHDEIVKMSDGYDSLVGERGSHLSGGQRQRLSIARALAEQPDLLVLDEPTSALDVRSEALIRRTLKELSSRTTVVVIAHRLSTLDICDRIMVVHEGRIQGFDTPARLEATDPFYRDALELSGLR
jgi:ABC-type multidrug transport system fused ATPase/permease subunit